MSPSDSRILSLRPARLGGGLLVLALGALAGCDLLDRRSPSPSPVTLDDPPASGAADPAFQKPEELRGFFKPRPSGAWSSEAREIERSLGAQ